MGDSQQMKSADRCHTCSMFLLVQSHLDVLHQQFPVVGTWGFGGRNHALVDLLGKKPSVNNNNPTYSYADFVTV